MFVTSSGLRTISWHMSQYKEYVYNISDILVYNTNTFLNTMAFDISMGLFINIQSFKNLKQMPHQIATLSNFDWRDFP